MTEELFDDIRLVVFVLRYKCKGVHKIEKVIEMIVAGSPLTEERVRSALTYIGNV